MLTRCKRSVSA